MGTSMQIVGHADLHSLASPDVTVLFACLYAAGWLISQLYAQELH